MKNLAVWFLAAALLVAAPATARTDQRGDEQEEPESEEQKLRDDVMYFEKIRVTAQLREEALREVPFSLTAFSADRITDAGIRSPEDFVALVPNVFMANSFTVGNSFITIRGISQVNNTDPSVAVVTDGVYQTNQKQLTQELVDIERIEVLKGPQGALYGRNSLGGVFNIITRGPTNEYEGFVAATLGNGSTYGLSAAVGGPLVKDRLQFRFTGTHKQSDGLIDNVFLNTEADFYDDTTGRFQLRWLAGQRTTFDFRVSSSDSEGGAALYSIFPTTGFANDFSFKPDESFLGFSERDMTDYTLRATWRGESMTLTAITGASDLTEVYRGDADFSNPTRGLFSPFGPIGQGQDLDVRTYSQEIRLTSPDDHRLRWIAGGYLLETDRALTTQGFLDTDGTLEGFVPIIFISEDNDNTAFAFFGQLDYRISDRWRITAGARYDEDEREQTDLTNGSMRTRTFDQLQPRLSVQCDLSESWMTYANLSTGFRSGGYNAPVVTPDVFREETLDNLELGFKSELAGGQVSLSAAAYVSKIDDAQFFRLDFVNAAQIIDNINEVTMRGLELDLVANPAEGWEVYTALAFNDSEIDDFDGSGAFAGNQTPSNIRYQAHLGTRYARPLSGKLVGVARADLELRGKQYWHPDNLDVQDPVELVHLRLGLVSAAWEVTAWARNLFDEEYYVEYADAFWAGILSGDDIGHLGPPRSYGIDVRRKF